MCKFCKRNTNDGLCNEVASKKLGLGLDLTVNITEHEFDYKTRHIRVSINNDYGEVIGVKIPIEYCPKCGKKLSKGVEA